MMASRGEPGDDHDRRADGNEREDRRIEDRRVAKAVVDAALEAERLANIVGGRERQDRRRKDGRVEQTQRKEQRSKVSGKRSQRYGDVAGAGDDGGVCRREGCGRKIVAAQETMMK